MFSKDELIQAQDTISQHMLPTPQISWPLLGQELGAQVIVKHENHAPTGAFKVRGGITFIDWLKREHPSIRGIITATRGNHGQSQARAAIAAGLTAKVLVPRGNSVEKNAATVAYGAQLVEFGADFEEARNEAMRLAELDNLFPVPPFHRELLRGVATYGLELFNAHPDLDTVYVPIGCGSGLCGTIAARDALDLNTEIIGVVASNASGAKLSVAAGHIIETNSADTIADGMAVRVPVQEALDIYSKGAARIVDVSEDEITAAMRMYFRTIHNVAEGAGAAGLAAAIQEKNRNRGKKIGLILSGGNVDLPVFRKVLDVAD